MVNSNKNASTTLQSIRMQSFTSQRHTRLGDLLIVCAANQCPTMHILKWNDGAWCSGMAQALSMQSYNSHTKYTSANHNTGLHTSQTSSSTTTTTTTTITFNFCLTYLVFRNYSSLDKFFRDKPFRFLEQPFTGWNMKTATTNEMN